MEIPRESFNDSTQEAERLMLHLKANLVAQRPIPTSAGLQRLGHEIDMDNSGPLELESAFLLHAAMADMSS